MEQKITEAVRRYGMEQISEGAIIGFSGGADSSALLHYMKGRCKHLLVVHINHMIRGEEADRDEEFCKATAKAYGVDFLSFRIDVPAIAKSTKKGLEEAARDERYRVFFELLEKHPQYKCILTAHNANDNGETVIFNLTRGTGANGLRGIKPVWGKIMRPLIYCTREDIIKYCLDNNIEYVTDSTNSDTDYTRNNIRKNILPRLMEVNPNFLEACARLGEILGRDEEYICREAEGLLSGTKDGKLPKSVATSAHPAVLARVIKSMAQVNLDYTAVSSALSLIEGWQSGKMVNLSHGLTFKLEHDYCHFIKTEDVSRQELFAYLEEGVNRIDSQTVITVNADLCEEGYRLTGSVTLEKAQVQGALYVRSRKEGDTVYSGGMTKKLKKVFTDRHIPSEERWRIPVVCDGGGVLAVPGIIARDGAFKRNGDLTIKVYKK